MPHSAQRETAVSRDARQTHLEDDPDGPQSPGYGITLPEARATGTGIGVVASTAGSPARSAG